MKLDKAIRRLQLYVKHRKPNPDDNFHESVQLLIEAGKHLQNARLTDPTSDQNLLPGETKD